MLPSSVALAASAPPTQRVSGSSSSTTKGLFPFSSSVHYLRAGALASFWRPIADSPMIAAAADNGEDSLSHSSRAFSIAAAFNTQLEVTFFFNASALTPPLPLFCFSSSPFLILHPNSYGPFSPSPLSLSLSHPLSLSSKCFFYLTLSSLLSRCSFPGSTSFSSVRNRNGRNRLTWRFSASAAASQRRSYHFQK